MLIFNVSYDNFYNSVDLVKLDNIERFIASHITKDENGEYSGLFCYDYHLKMITLKP